MKYFMTGHGGWTVSDGYFDLPKGTTVKFYTENAKLMLSSDVYKIVNGTFKGSPTNIVGEYRSCQNMTLYPDDAEYIGPTDAALAQNPDSANCRVYRVTAAKKLKDIVKDLAGHEIIWCCCRDLSLRASATQVYDPKLKQFVPGVGSNLATKSGINAGVELDTGKFLNFNKATWNWD
ncbi:putative adhesin [Methylomonas sp. BW4-1]|uniref:putative adhesin n=1 Tax=unclassified Methylomonas TaxID=2608980 RepID=UPI001968A203|nr:hypothetical protein [Methylomonas sp. EFPC1]QSB01014.1 hypothetical protein JWZ98_20605 [Methylomonas sp. EFPC1]